MQFITLGTKWPYLSLYIYQNVIVESSKVSNLLVKEASQYHMIGIIFDNDINGNRFRKDIVSFEIE